jgi:hypothetical protein
MRSLVEQLQHDVAFLRGELAKALHEVEVWRDRYESVLADAQRMERSFDEAWRYDERDH